MSQRFSFDHKLERADKHLQSLKEQIERWLATNPYRVIDEIDPNTREDVVRVQRVGAPPEIISLILGDCLHNLRSALDHIIYTLSVKPNAGIELSDEIMRGVSFPIFKCEKEFHTRGKKRIKLVVPGAQTVVESLQPLKAGDDYASHWLWLLNEMDNFDKHRSVIIAMVMAKNLLLDGPAGVPTLVKYMKIRGLNPNENNTEVARYCAVNASNPSQRVKIKFTAPTSVAFCDGTAKGREVLETISGIRNYIAYEVIPKFTDFLR